MEELEARIEELYEAPKGVAVLLEIVEDPNIVIPIFISKGQAQSIEAGRRGVSPRPLTHDILLDIIKDMGLEVSRITIDDLVNGTFMAELRLSKEEDEFPYDIRPSDGIAISVREPDLKIFISQEVVDKAGVEKDELKKMQ